MQTRVRLLFVVFGVFLMAGVLTGIQRHALVEQKATLCDHDFCATSRAELNELRTNARWQ